MEIKSMKKRIEEIVGEQTGINEQIAFSRQRIQAIINEHQEIQSLNAQISKLVRDSNILTGNIAMLIEFVKIEEEDQAAIKERLAAKAKSAEKGKKKK